MADNKFTIPRKAESKFIGDSRELKNYLLQKIEVLQKLLKSEKDKVRQKKIKERILLVEDMLDQKYFTDDRVYTMDEMIEAIKIERADLKAEYESMEPNLNDAKKLAYDAFKAAGEYLANKFETERYNSSEQVKLRELIVEYEALRWEYESIVHCWRTLWKLLGVIHRPLGFFEKII